MTATVGGTAPPRRATRRRTARRRELTEAARGDGAGPVRTALRVKAPLVRPSVVMVVLIALSYGVSRWAGRGGRRT
ncbi:hypothetical protein ACFPM3_18200 [Streptomyces coeruleoprunus]|uniref:Uncharacterized protein n=1 Tax=Streptomyces coeruleoprunus TaxID=285563 RepID=A0ABV9XIF2_9ACTN